ncbi:MAG: hypothetical protein G01um1014106_673 [Parcubacteria group bacterium Gr01-1014_106]|nr:MAG: hypothetical protein G01um1014106_673 [Parcubacteria group bacterium Gr01-1014_106]
MSQTPSALLHASALVQETPASASLDAAVLATLAYHDLLHLPLTSVQVWRYLLRPRAGGQGTGNRGQGTESPTLRDVEQSLHTLVERGVLETANGFFVFAGHRARIAEWPAKHARSQQKWRRLRRIVFWLQCIPFLRGVAGTGSLAFDNAKPTSDLDVLIIAAPNRVWTVRFFLTVLLDLFRLRRRPQGVTSDRVCLNHYLAADALSFPYQSLYTALEYARMVPLIGEHTCWAFRAANRSWMERYLFSVFPDTVHHKKSLPSSPALRSTQRLFEWMLFTPLGNALERFLASLQRTRIARSDRSRGLKGRIVATNTRAEFHPQSREAPILAAFNARMETLGLEDRFGGQADSGLTR